MSTSSNRVAVADRPARDHASGLILLRPAVLPAMLFLLALILPQFMFWQGAPKVTEGLGPAAWPDLILDGLAIFSAIWLVHELWVLGRAGRRPMLKAQEDDEVYRYGKALVGILLIVIYGAVLSLVGFALATAGFIAIWTLYGGIRNPLVVASVSLIGTAILLWVFMGLALMPLSRGQGGFDHFSIWLLQTLGIY
ncbi:tripartite tricarboxylate transporter TctB family protein [Paracoccus seriniphilus]|uniref:Putative tricarboxylic transport membrane protein n=1 Tax=Paracoccus seriniphilus TaxID=184748 RepID=A0A239PQW5_9RHOB|nr:tripartite tricarboxylate transporter TctB family protein [Paracoccus seriniphilus]WCR13031.1 tripartite tricarboxylate transporter TctB family protein [Paracoccus seriniphilus]SNT72528.1 putative tricarboxylic transport membrane protein [Paracoccus seriniphilus]